MPADASQSSVPHPQRRRLTLLAMCVATFMIQLDVTIVNVALPAIQRQLQVPPGSLEWVISGYALSLAALIPVSGALGDRYGRRRVFLAGVVVFAIGSVACALSANETVLVAFRVLQGAGGAAMLALTLSILTETFPPETRAGAIGTWAAVGGTGFGVGPAAGGILLTFFGWASVFWVNLPFAVIAIVLTAVAVRPTGSRQPRRLDLPGAAASAVGLFAVTLGLTESAANPWGSRAVAAPIVVGVALLAVFIGWERRCGHAMIPPALLAARSFVSAAGVYFISYTAFSGVLFYVTLLYQDVDGWSPLRTGLSWLFLNAPFLLSAQLAGRLDRRYPVAAVVAAGCVAGAVGVFALSAVSPTTPFVLTAAGFGLCGAGFGVLVPGVSHVAMRDVPPEISGAASGVLNASRQIGTSVGLAVLGTVGVTAAVSHWQAAARGFPAAIRAEALRQAPNVGGARINAVAQALGRAYRQPAAQSFAHGYHLAVGVGAGCLLAAAVVSFVGFRQPAAAARGLAAAPVRPLAPRRLPRQASLGGLEQGSPGLSDPARQAAASTLPSDRFLAFYVIELVLRMTVPIAARDVAAAAGAILILGAVVSVVGTVIVPRNTGSRLTRLVTRVVNGLFRLLCRPVSSYRRRDRIMAGQAAVILLGQIAVWLGSFYVGYALLIWPVTDSIGVAFTSVGPALWTFGDPNAHGFFETAVLDSAAMAGLITVTLQIAYLPHLYAAFNRRENEIALLNSRAGMPSWGPELLARTHYALGSGTSSLYTLPEFYGQWERWAADVTESHVTYSPLAWFRSPSHEASWATALLSVLDSAALYLALCPQTAPAVPARLCLRSGMVCFGEVARSMGLKVPADPAPDAGISLSYDEFLDAVARLGEVGFPIEREPEAAWPHFVGWRVNYEQAAYAIAEAVDAVPALWSGPRRRPAAPIPPLRPGPGAPPL